MARGGIDLGGTKIQAVVVDDRHRVRGEARHRTPTTGGPPAITAAMAAALREAASAAGLTTADLTGVGVGSPGAIDAGAGVVSHAGNLDGWAGSFAVGPTLAQTLGTRVALGNDVQVATDAEYAIGAGRPYRSLLGVFWGTGIGGGLILDGRPWLGRGSAGEIGHVVVQLDGAPCPCGRLGCLEAYAGRGAMEIEARRQVALGRPTRLFEIMERRGKPRLASGVWEDALEDGDALAEDLMTRAVAALGAGIASTVNLLDVEAVIVGGGIGTRFGQPIADRIAAAMLPHLFVSEQPPAVRVAELGDLGGAIGAALQVADPAVDVPAAGGTPGGSSPGGAGTDA
jgi:glucokinase